MRGETQCVLAGQRRATDRALGRSVAAKVLHRELQDDPGVVDRFLSEVRLAASLEHPNILPIHALGVREELGPFFTMKLVDGHTLHDLLAEHRRTPAGDDLARIVDVLIDVCDALALAHDRGVVHGDLKGRNVLVGPYGQVYLTDWGNALRVGEAPPSGPDGRALVLGTPGMLAPEQARGEPWDARTDVFGMGALLYTVLTRRVPYSRGGPQGQVDAAREGRFAPIEELTRRAPLPLRELSARCMAVDPADRPQSIDEVRGALDAYRRVRVEAPVQRVRRGEMLIEQGDDSPCLYIVQEGRFLVTQRGLRPNTQELARLGPGSIVGELGVLTGKPRTASVLALTDGVVLRLEPQHLRQELDRVAPWLRSLVFSLAERASSLPP